MPLQSVLCMRLCGASPASATQSLKERSASLRFYAPWQVGIFPDGKLPVPDLPLSPAKACRAIAEAGLNGGVDVMLRGTKGGQAAAVEAIKLERS